MKLWYERPAQAWTEALPIGNGRLGAMAFGGVETERLQLNEDTLWSGAPRDWNNPQAKEVLPEVRRLVAEGKFVEADTVCKQMMGPYNQSYLPLGNAYLHFYHGDNAKSYRRELDLDTAVAATTYTMGEVVYTREVFASHPDQAIVIRLSVNKLGMLAFRAAMDSQLRYKTSWDSRAGTLILQGKCPKHVTPGYHGADLPVVYDADTGEGMTFDCRMKVLDADGQVWADHDGLHVQGATVVTLLISAATSFNGYDRSPGLAGKDPSSVVESSLQTAQEKTYEALRLEHVQDYQALYGRVDLKLGSESRREHQPTDRRIRDQGAQDLGLVELLFQYGRYLLIASSRPGTQPANLQGIWNCEARPPWSSNWTLNINTEMNYWPAETCNLSECHQPLLDYIGELAVNGRKTARINYGCRGWTAHHNGDVWRQSAPAGDFGAGDPVWAIWPMAAAWLCQHLWEHYRFSGDKEFLAAKAYPVMKEAAEFYLDWLIEDGDGYLITSPSTSPEHKFITTRNEKAAVSQASTMDVCLIWDLFTNCIEAMEFLNRDLEFRDSLDSARRRLRPLKIGQYGQLQEWSHDFADEDQHHRHVSHLFGVHPGRQLTAQSSPKFFNAARCSLQRRGDGGTGWSLAWKINLWARFGDGDRAGKLISNLLTLVEDGRTNYHRGGVYANLFDAHPPFQIDGNFGFTAGVAEMLMQSHTDEICLLPALPTAWHYGRVTGLRARGGFEIDIAWEDGQLTSARVVSLLGGGCRLRVGVGKRVHVTELASGSTVASSSDAGHLEFTTAVNGAYSLEVE